MIIVDRPKVAEEVVTIRNLGEGLLPECSKQFKTAKILDWIVMIGQIPSPRQV